MFSILFAFLTITFVVATESCNSLQCRTVHYEEMGCKPVASDCCPTRFECPPWENLDPTKCHYFGNYYKHGDVLESPDIMGNCRGRCVCDANNGNGQFKCTFLECPEHVAWDENVEECVFQSALDKCCSINRVCGSQVNTLAKCNFEGITYHEGEIMYARDSMHKCLCTKDFTATNLEKNPNCAVVKCGVNLHMDEILKGCVPIYYKDSGCFLAWRCPDENDTVIKAIQPPNESQDPNMICKFGKMKLSLGDSIADLTDTKGIQMNCTCIIPPMISCIEH